jgi:hypothetical protein
VCPLCPNPRDEGIKCEGGGEVLCWHKYWLCFVFNGPLQAAQLCEYTLAPLVEAAWNRKTGHIRSFVVSSFAFPALTFVLCRRPLRHSVAALTHDTLSGVIMTFRDISPCFVCCEEPLVGGYFILTPHSFDARHGRFIHVLFRCAKMTLESGKGTNVHTFYTTSLPCGDLHVFVSTRYSSCYRGCSVNFISVVSTCIVRYLHFVSVVSTCIVRYLHFVPLAFVIMPLVGPNIKYSFPADVLVLLHADHAENTSSRVFYRAGT